MATINATSDPESKQGRRGWKPMANNLSYGTAPHIILTFALYESEWSASLPGRIIPWERSSDTQWTGGWMSPRAGLDVLENRKIFFSLSEMELWSFIPFRNHYTDCYKRAVCIVLFAVLISCV
jgi:hypothetical protein